MDRSTQKYTLYKAITPLRFCHWLQDYLDKVNISLLPRAMSSPTKVHVFELLPYLDNLEGPEPYVVIVVRIVWILTFGRTYSVPRPDDPRFEEPRRAFSITIARLPGGSQLDVECDKEQGISLESLVSALDELSDLEIVSTETVAMERWKPPSNCVFNGDCESFLTEGQNRLKARGYRGGIFGNGLEFIVTDPVTKKRIARGFAVPVPRGDGRSCISFEPDQGDWAVLREQIEQMIDDLLADKWIEMSTASATVNTAGQTTGQDNKLHTISFTDFDKLIANFDAELAPIMRVVAEATGLFARTSGILPDDEYRDAVILVRKAAYKKSQDIEAMAVVNGMDKATQEKWKEPVLRWRQVEDAAMAAIMEDFGRAQVRNQAPLFQPDDAVSMLGYIMSKFAASYLKLPPELSTPPTISGETKVSQKKNTLSRRASSTPPAGEDAPPSSGERGPKEETQRAATIAHYLIKKEKISQHVACNLAQIDPKTYRRYKGRNWILSDAEFHKTWGTSIEAAASKGNSK
jgi:hypothetical protein